MWSSLDPIGLDELDELQDRVDAKYVLPVSALPALLDRLDHRVLEIDGRRVFGYRSTYFDTPELRLFRDHVQQRRRRYKCRTREYDTGLRMFEVKLKGPRGRTVKYRSEQDTFAFLDETLRREYDRAPDPGLRPTLDVAYERVTLAAPGERVTLDFDLRFSDGRMRPDRLVVETKSANGNARADKALRELGARPESGFSKYCLGIGLKHPRATLRRALALHFVALAMAPAAHAMPSMKIRSGPIPNEKKTSATLRMPGYSGKIGIELRGQSSQQFAKKSFAIELRDAKGEDRKAPLLGMPEDGDWVLYAGANDKTLMRNVVAYATARALGRYAPRTRFVKLHLNGRYHGIYVLTERVELGKERVQGDALLEFTFPFQARSKNPSFRGPVRGRPIVWEDPERKDLSSTEANAIAAPVRAAERALYGRGSWRTHIDEAAAVDYVLLQELFKNQDAFLGSTYVALANGKLVFGPLWDFDISGGNAGSGASQYSSGWLLKRRHWSGRLWQDPGFERALRERWAQLNLRDAVKGAIDEASRDLRGEVGRNFTRWPVLHRPLWPATTARGSHGAEVDFLRRWMSRRIAWMDRQLR